MKKKSIFVRFPELAKIPAHKFPKHLLIIPDGNGRWAKAHNQSITKGHQKGFFVADNITKDLSEIQNISIITMWGFSSDNWKRGEQEIGGLMIIFRKAIEKILQMENRRFIHLGRKDRLPSELAKFIRNAERITAQNKGQIICLAIDFGGEDQTLRMIEKARQLPQDVPTTMALVSQLRDGEGLIPPADLLIRTSSEQRTSDIGWLNGAPTELYISPKLFPDIETADIVAAIIDFSKRERRFGSRLSPSSPGSN